MHIYLYTFNSEQLHISLGYLLIVIIICLCFLTFAVLCLPTEQKISKRRLFNIFANVEFNSTPGLMFFFLFRCHFKLSSPSDLRTGLKIHIFTLLMVDIISTSKEVSKSKLLRWLNFTPCSKSYREDLNSRP